MTNAMTHFKDLRPDHDLFSKSMLFITVLVIYNIITLMLIYTIWPFILYIHFLHLSILYFHILFQYLMMAIEKNFCIWMAQYLLHIKVPAYVYYKF